MLYSQATFLSLLLDREATLKQFSKEVDLNVYMWAYSQMVLREKIRVSWGKDKMLSWNPCEQKTFSRDIRTLRGRARAVKSKHLSNIYLACHTIFIKSISESTEDKKKHRLYKSKIKSIRREWVFMWFIQSEVSIK